MGVSRVFRVGTPFNAVELPELDFEQTADTMYFAHIDHPPAKLTRQAHDSWLFSDVSFGPALPVPTGINAISVTPNTDSDNDGKGYFSQPASYCVTAVDENDQESRASATDTVLNDLTLKRNYNIVTWSAVTGAVRYNVYKADNTQFFGYVGTTDELSFTDDNIGPALDRAPPEGFNPFGDAGDYPSTVTFFEQRLMYGRSRNEPSAAWGSRSAEFENFDKSTPLQANDSLSFSIVSGRVNAINQLVSTTSLLALTSDSIFRVDGDPDGGYLTATQVSARRQIGRGCSRLSPLVVDNVVFYQPSVGNGVRSINYSFEMDGLKSDDVTIFSPHFFEGFDIVSWCYSQEPRSIVWAVRSDGKLLAFTWEQAQQVWGWTICETEGFVTSCCSISEEGEDRVYLTVRRTINGEDRTFIERMASHRWDDVADCCFLDCAVSFALDEPTNEFNNLWHLEGETVAGLIDGMVARDLVVTDGKITLPDNYGTVSKATFGLPYDVDIQTMPVMFNGPQGAVAGRKQQPGEIVLHLRDSRGVLAGASEETVYEIKPRSDEDWGAADSLKNGKYLVDSANVVAGESSVYIKQTDPLPLTLIGVFMDPIVGG